MADTIVRRMINEPEADALFTAYNALRQDLKTRFTSVHVDANLAPDATPVAADLPTLQTLCNAMKAKYNTHIARADAHLVADAVNVNATTAAVDLATSIALINALKAAFNLHCAQATIHVNNDAGTIATANGTVLGDTITLANAFQTALNAHMAKAATSTALVRGPA